MRSGNDTLTTRLAHVIERAGGPSAVARILGLTPPAVAAWTRGSVPYVAHQLELCEKLGISERWLRFGEGREDDTEEAKSLKEEALGEVDTTALSKSLAEMILGFSKLPHTYEAMALAQIEEHFAEFVRRARLRISIRKPGTNHVKYTKPKKK